MPAADSEKRPQASDDDQAGVDHLLVRTVQAVIEGEADDDELVTVIERSRKRLKEYELGYTETIEQLSDEVRERCHPLVENGYELFEEFYAALDELSKYLEDDDQEHLYVGGGQASRAAHQMNSLFTELRNVGLAAQGPTDIPTLNLLVWTYDQWTEDPDRWTPRLRGIVEAERLLSVAALQDLEKTEKTPEYSTLEKAFDAHLRCMNRLAFALDEDRNDDVVTEVEKARGTFERIRDVLPLANVSSRLAGPTQSPDVNLVISLVDDVEQAKVHQGVLLEALDRLKNNFEQSRKQFAALAAKETESVLLKEEIEKTHEAHELQEEAIEGLYAFFESRELLVLRTGVERLEESAHRLYECYEGFQDIADREGKSPCIRCSHYNPVDRNTCEKCGASLPVTPGATTTTFSATEAGPRMGLEQGTLVTENLLKVYEAVNAIDAGEITTDEFLDVIEWFGNLVEVNARAAAQLPEVSLEDVPEDELEEAEVAERAMEQVDLLFAEGVEDLRTAISLWRSYAETDNANDLAEGVRICDQGAQKINQVRIATAPPEPPQEEEAEPAGDSFDAPLI